LVRNALVLVISGSDNNRVLVFSNQGDQIGRIFAQWVIVYSGQVFFNYRSSPHCWAAFQQLRLCISALVLTKNGWATIWAIFLQTHLVTLLVSSHQGCQICLGMYMIPKLEKYIK
jgi:hypothetical protein